MTFNLWVTISTSCTACALRTVLLDASIAAGESQPEVSLPLAWNIINGKPYCPKHKLAMFDVVNHLPVLVKL